jgi:hypothetical protein
LFDGLAGGKDLRGREGVGKRGEHV